MELELGNWTGQEIEGCAQSAFSSENVYQQYEYSVLAEVPVHARYLKDRHQNWVPLNNLLKKSLQFLVQRDPINLSEINLWKLS